MHRAIPQSKSLLHRQRIAPLTWRLPSRRIFTWTNTSVYVCTISDGRIRSPELRRPRRPSIIAFPPFPRARGKRIKSGKKEKQGPSRWLAAEEQSLPASLLAVDWSRFNETVARTSLGLNRSGEIHRKKTKQKKPFPALPGRAGGSVPYLLTLTAPIGRCQIRPKG